MTLRSNPKKLSGRRDRDFFPTDLAEKFRGDDEKVLEAGELENIEDKYIVGDQESYRSYGQSPPPGRKWEHGWLNRPVLGYYQSETQKRRSIETNCPYRTSYVQPNGGTGRRRAGDFNRRAQNAGKWRRGSGRRRKSSRPCLKAPGQPCAMLSEEDLMIIQANKKLEEVLGIHREEMENKKSLWEFLADGELEKMKEQGLALRSGSDGVPAGVPAGREYRFVDRQGNEKDLFATMALIPGTRRITASFLDVTERNHREKALKRSEERHQWMVEKAPVAIGVIQKGVFKFINPRVIEIFGYSQEELASQPVLEFIHTDDRKMDKLLFKESNDGELPHVFFFKIVHKDGTIRWVEDRMDLIHWEGSPATINFFTDITLRKQAEDEWLSALQPFRVLIEKAQKVMTTEQEPE